MVRPGEKLYYRIYFFRRLNNVFRLITQLFVQLSILQYTGRISRILEIMAGRIFETGPMATKFSSSSAESRKKPARLISRPAPFCPKIGLFDKSDEPGNSSSGSHGPSCWPEIPAAEKNAGITGLAGPTGMGLKPVRSKPAGRQRRHDERRMGFPNRLPSAESSVFYKPV